MRQPCLYQVWTPSWWCAPCWTRWWRTPRSQRCARLFSLMWVNKQLSWGEVWLSSAETNLPSSHRKCEWSTSEMRCEFCSIEAKTCGLCHLYSKTPQRSGERSASKLVGFLLVLSDLVLLYLTVLRCRFRNLKSAVISWMSDLPHVLEHTKTITIKTRWKPGLKSLLLPRQPAHHYLSCCVEKPGQLCKESRTSAVPVPWSFGDMETWRERWAWWAAHTFQKLVLHVTSKLWRNQCSHQFLGRVAMNQEVMFL